MTKDKMKEYERWRNKLITVAVRDFGFAYDVIEPLASGHLYKSYFEDGDTPYQALQSSELNGL